MATFPCHIVHLSIPLASDDVYAFASDPMNLPRWASGLCDGIQPAQGHWLLQTDQGLAADDLKALASILILQNLT